MPELNMPFGLGNNSMYGDIGNSLASLLGGMFPGKNPYDQAIPYFQQGTNQATQTLNPFYQAGTGALPQYENILSKMSNPSEFINNLMTQYHESPAAHYLQEQGTRAAMNKGSAEGTIGSTPMAQFISQQSQGIASQDMNDWLRNVLGVNTEALGGYNSLISGGQNAGNSIANLQSQLGAGMGQAAYGGQDWRNSNRGGVLGGIISLLKHLGHQ